MGTIRASILFLLPIEHSTQLAVGGSLWVTGYTLDLCAYSTEIAFMQLCGIKCFSVALSGGQYDG